MAFRMASAAGILASLALLGTAHSGEAVRLLPSGGRAVNEPVPVCFGAVFRAGEIPRDRAVEVRAGGKPVPAQVEIKRRHTDGSAKHALVALLLPGLEAEGLGLDFAPAEPAAAPEIVPGDAAKKLLAGDFDAVATFTFPDGSRRSASARALLEKAGDKAETWLAGPAVTEWLLTGSPAGEDGKADPDLRVQFQIRAWAGCPAVRVSVVVENCLDTWAGNISYSVEVRLGRKGKPAWERRDVDHHSLSRWRKVFWWPQNPPEAQAVHNWPRLAATGLLPNFDPAVRIPQADLARLATGWERARRDILEPGTVTQYMPTTGGRDDIGPYPAWTVRYLLSMDARARAVTMGNGDLAGSWPIHVRSSATGRLMTIDDRPKFWLDARGQDKPAWQKPRREPAAAHKYVPDCAHQPSLAYVPYLLTGDFYYLEEVCFWANYCLLAQWPSPRRDGAGLVLGDQVRGQGWALRNLGDAAAIAPDGSPEARYFETKLRNNIQALTKRTCGPPEANALGVYGPRTVQDARIQSPAKASWMVVAPWENDYLIWSLHHLTELGYAEAARPRDFMLRLRVGALTSAGDFDPRLAAPYRMVVGERGPDKQITFYDTWKKMGEENLRLNKPGLPEYPGSYSYGARMAVICGVDGAFSKSEEAFKYLERTLPKVREALTASPSWALAPRRR